MRSGTQQARGKAKARQSTPSERVTEPVKGICPAENESSASDDDEESMRADIGDISEADAADTDEQDLRHVVAEMKAKLEEIEQSRRDLKEVDSSTTKNDIHKELIKLIPNYDGKGGISKFTEFVKNFENYAKVKRHTPLDILLLATSKLTNDAKMWWHKHEDSTPDGDSKRIVNWEMLKADLKRTFVPVETAEETRIKIRNIRQTGSIADYNATFRSLSMQINMHFDEERHDYLQGLKPRIRDLIRTKDNLKSIEEVMLTCLQLEGHEDSRQEAEALYATSRFRGRHYGRHPFTNARGGFHNNLTNTQNSPSRGHGNNHYRGRGGNRGHGGGTSRGRDIGAIRIIGGAARANGGLRCFKCNEIGHKARKCHNNQSAQQPQANLAIGAKATIIDSGASQHMFKWQNMFRNLIPNTSTVASAGTSSELKSKHIGMIDISINGQETTLRNVLHVPGLRHNLLSVRALTKNGNDVVFKQNGDVELINGNNSTKIGHAIGDVFQLKMETAFSANVSNSDYTLWHHRFGHPGREALLSLPKHVIGLEHARLQATSGGICHICMMAKSHRLPFGAATRRATEPLERVHSDICGPITSSTGESRYVLTFIDDATRYAKIYVIRHKSDAVAKFIEYKAFSEWQTGKALKILRTDCGREFVNEAMADHLTRNGILHETTVPYNPEQNGVAERFNRSLFESIRSLLHSAATATTSRPAIPDTLWIELAVTATYLRNRLPSKANVGNKTPYEGWHGHKPLIGNLRVIWADAYAHIPKPNCRNKLEPRATKLKLIGYHDEKKAYRLWDPITQRVSVSRDVVFDESVAMGMPQTLGIATDEEDEYPIDAIIDEKIDQNGKLYLVKWLGYSDDDNTWEPLEHVAGTEAYEKWNLRKTGHAEADMPINALRADKLINALAGNRVCQLMLCRLIS